MPKKINCINCKNMKVKIPLKLDDKAWQKDYAWCLDYNTSTCRCVALIQRDTWNVGEQFRKYGKIIGGIKSWERDDCIMFDSMDE